ncbi:proline-rich proteoglycan 2-like [Drosophila biarmipes]|uniref:proline-rich proteoglycan 2-like n=1 Tax=Drosophila biarmipes TaxID=125945 RepID=UPI001CDB14AD|nr:proline-rich proteoglycan 2-like [Drosophila biarmipes]
MSTRVTRSDARGGGGFGRPPAAQTAVSRPEEADDRAASPPGWLPEVPLTPRYERSPTRPPSPEGKTLSPRSQPPPRQDKPPPPEPDTPPPPTRRDGECPRWRPARPPTPRFQRPPAAESQQTVVWTWPENPAEETAASDEPRIWEERRPRVGPLDPRTRGRPDLWTPPTPNTRPSTPSTRPSTPSSGPTTPAATRNAAEAADPQERGPWKWPEPTGG